MTEEIIHVRTQIMDMLNTTLEDVKAFIIMKMYFLQNHVYTILGH